MSKRKNGEGSWGTKVINGFTYKFFKKQYDGFDNPQYFYGKTDAEVNEKRKIFEENIESKRILAQTNKTGITFGQYIESWLKEVKEREVSQGTYDGYERIVRVRMKEFRGYDLYNKQMQQLDADPAIGIQIMTRYVDALIEHGYSVKTIRETYDIISQCMNYACNPIRRDLKYNYMKLVPMPSEEKVKKKKKEIHFMNEDEMERLYQETKRVYPEGRRDAGKRYYGNNAYAIVILMYTGMRIGELAGLRWKDVNLEKKTMFIHRSLRDIVNREKKSKDDGLPSFIPFEKETKTKNAIRTLSITNRVMEALEFFLQFKKSDDDYVCVSSNHTYLRRDGVARTLQRMSRNANLAYLYTPHELRHSFGSIILDKSDNVDRAITAISRILGHANITITYNIYIHVLDERLTTTFQMLDYTEEDDENIDFEDFDEFVEVQDNSTTQNNADDGIDYKQKYEELLASLESLKALIPT